MDDDRASMLPTKIGGAVGAVRPTAAEPTLASMAVVGHRRRHEDATVPGMAGWDGPKRRALIAVDPMSVRDRALRRLRFRILLLIGVFVVPGLIVPLTRHVTGGALVRVVVGELCFIVAIGAGVLASRRDRPLRHGFGWVGVAAALVAVGYGCYQL
jgi:hypothetical protein